MITNYLAQLDIAEQTDIGSKRQRNEDATRIVIPPFDSEQRALGGLFIVADGMGGLGGGDIASQYAIDEIIRFYYNLNVAEPNIIYRFRAALEAANIRVREQAPRLGLARIGSTVAGIILLPDGKTMIFNVGDCRVYRIRAGQITRVSHDQSVTERQVEAGMISEETARTARSSMVTAFIGQPIPLEPNIDVEAVIPNDIYVICSDGLWSLVEPRDIMRAVHRHSAQIAVQTLVKLALKAGGNDNISAVVVRLGRAPSGQWFIWIGMLGLILSGLLMLYLLLNSPTSLTVSETTNTPTVWITPESNSGLQILPSATPLSILSPTQGSDTFF